MAVNAGGHRPAAWIDERPEVGARRHAAAGERGKAGAARDQEKHRLRQRRDRPEPVDLNPDDLLAPGPSSVTWTAGQALALPAVRAASRRPGTPAPPGRPR